MATETGTHEQYAILRGIFTAGLEMMTHGGVPRGRKMLDELFAPLSNEELADLLRVARMPVEPGNDGFVVPMNYTGADKTIRKELIRRAVANGDGGVYELLQDMLSETLSEVFDDVSVTADRDEHGDLYDRYLCKVETHQFAISVEAGWPAF